MKAIRVHSHGGPDVLAYEDVEIGHALAIDGGYTVR
jgi:hypothetical protein